MGLLRTFLQRLHSAWDRDKIVIDEAALEDVPVITAIAFRNVPQDGQVCPVTSFGELSLDLAIGGVLRMADECVRLQNENARLRAIVETIHG